MKSFKLLDTFLIHSSYLSEANICFQYFVQYECHFKARNNAPKKVFCERPKSLFFAKKNLSRRAIAVSAENFISFVSVKSLSIN